METLILGSVLKRVKMRITGIEPISSAWKADNLPLIYIRLNLRLGPHLAKNAIIIPRQDYLK